MIGDVRSDEGGEASIRNDEGLRIVLVGRTGAGKSATGNTILGSEPFESRSAFESVTVSCGEASDVVAFRKVSLVDTPGLFDTRLSEDETLEKISDCVSLAAPGPHAFLVVIKLERFTDEGQRSVEMIQKVFGPKSNEYTMILFTNGDQQSAGHPVDEMLKKCPKLQELVSTCKGRYHVFNNKTKDPSQVNELLEKINQMVVKNGGSHYTNKMFQEAARKIKEEKERVDRENERKRDAERDEWKEQGREEERKKSIFDKLLDVTTAKLRGFIGSALKFFAVPTAIIVSWFIGSALGVTQAGVAAVAACVTAALWSSIVAGAVWVYGAVLAMPVWLAIVIGAIVIVIGVLRYLYIWYNRTPQRERNH